MAKNGIESVVAYGHIAYTRYDKKKVKGHVGVGVEFVNGHAIDLSLTIKQAKRFAEALDAAIKVASGN